MRDKNVCRSRTKQKYTKALPRRGPDVFGRNKKRTTPRDALPPTQPPGFGQPQPRYGDARKKREHRSKRSKRMADKRKQKPVTPSSDGARLFYQQKLIASVEIPPVLRRPLDQERLRLLRTEPEPTNAKVPSFRTRSQNISPPKLLIRKAETSPKEDSSVSHGKALSFIS